MNKNLREYYYVYSLKPISQDLRTKGFIDNLPKNCYQGKVFDHKLNCSYHVYRVKLNYEEWVNLMKVFRGIGIVAIKEKYMGIGL
jgi:hypothetical protein